VCELPSSRHKARPTRHFAYLLRCADGSLYAGYTTDPERRTAEHNAGSASRYTRFRRPVTLVHVEELESRGEALKREHEIKKLTRRQKLALLSPPTRGASSIR
jgi:putative endonuclease